MSISFECPQCQRRYEVDSSLAGKQVRCKACQEPIRIPETGGSPTTSLADEDVLADDRILSGEVQREEQPFGFFEPTPGPDTLEEPAAPDVEKLKSSPVASWADRVKSEIDKVYVGQRSLVRGVLIALLAEGHVLIESVPGLGKTLLVRVLGRVLGCDFNRIQFTPDLMPSDITGTSIYEEHTGEFRFRARAGLYPATFDR